VIAITLLREDLLFARENRGKSPISELFCFARNQSNKQILLLHYCQRSLHRKGITTRTPALRISGD